MKLNKLEIFNFREFYGKQTVRFGGKAEDDARNITVICGENGFDALDIYCAWMFCLFGETALDTESDDQRYDNAPDGSLINALALQEDALGERAGVKAYVQAGFTHRDRHYELLRALRGIRLEDAGIIVQREALKLTVTDGQGNTRIFEDFAEDKIIQEIEGLPAARFKHYYLLTGSKIEKFAGITRKKEIAAGIRCILGNEEIFAAEAAIRILEEMLNRELSRIPRDDDRQTEDIRARMEELSEKRKHLEKLLYDDAAYLADMVKKLENYASAVRLAQEYKGKTENQRRLQNGKEKALAGLRRFLPVTGPLLARELLADIYQDIDAQRVKEHIPPENKTELVEKILAEMTCICGRPVILNSAEHQHLLQWLAASGESLNREVAEVFGQIHGVISFLRGKSEELFQRLAEVGRIEEEYQAVTICLTQLEKQLTDLPDGEGCALDDFRERQRQVLERIAETEQHRKQVSETLSQVGEQQAKLGERLADFQAQSVMRRELREKYAVAAKARAVLGKILAQCTEETGKALESQANYNLRGMLKTEDRGTAGELVVNGDNPGDVRDAPGKPAPAKFTGPRQEMAALSLLLALAQLAGGARVLEFPLFLDFLPGGLCGEAGETLPAYLAQIAPQCILLVKGEKFGVREGKRLFATGKWHKFYTLATVKEGLLNLHLWPVELYQEVLGGRG